MSRDNWDEWREDLAALLAVAGRAEKQAYMERRSIRRDGLFLSERIAIDFECRAKELRK